MVEYLNGENVRLKAEYKDSSGTAYDPNTIELKIYDPIGVLKTTVTYAADEIQRNDTGVYFYDYTIPVDGSQGYWIQQYIGIITTGTVTDITEGQFFVRNINEKLSISVSEVKSALIADKITMDDDTIRMAIRSATEEVNTITGRNFCNKTAREEWFDTVTPNPATVIDRLFLMHLPMQEIITLEGYDTNNDLIKTYTSDDYYYDSNGIITLLRGEFPHSRHSVKVCYYSGYQAIPGDISRLTGVIARIDVMINYVMSTDDNATSYSIEGVSSLTQGEPYVSSVRILERLEKQKTALIATIGNLKCDVFIC